MKSKNDALQQRMREELAEGEQAEQGKQTSEHQKADGGSANANWAVYTYRGSAGEIARWLLRRSLLFSLSRKPWCETMRPNVT